jgi:hypothetical protein
MMIRNVALFGAMFAVIALCRAADTWIDSFEDGVLFDGIPECAGGEVCWEIQCTPGTYEIRCGDLVMGNPNAPAVHAALVMKETFAGDVSVRTQVDFIGGSSSSSVSLFVCGRAPCNGLYAATVKSGGLIRLRRWEGGHTPPVVLSETQMALAPENDHLLQLDRMGDRLELRLWTVGDEFPGPTLVATDDTFHSGQTGLLYASVDPDPNARGVFRFFQIAGSMIGPEGAAETGWHCAFRRGDTNGDGAVRTDDAIYTLQYLFAGGPAIACADTGDANDDGMMDISDGIYILQSLFGSGASIPLPYPACGVDTTADELTCETYEGCEGR